MRRLLRETSFPSRRSVLKARGFRQEQSLLVPGLYVHRVPCGVWIVLVGR